MNDSTAGEYVPEPVIDDYDASDCFAASRANGHLKLLARYPTLGLTSNRDALNQPVVATNYVPKADMITNDLLACDEVSRVHLTQEEPRDSDVNGRVQPVADEFRRG